MKRAFESKFVAWTTILVVTAIIGWVDWVTGHELSVFVVYFIPVSLGAWYLGLLPAVVEAIICAACWFAAEAMSGHQYSTRLFAVGNTLVRLCAFLCIGWAIHRIRQLLRSEQEKSELLQRSIAEIRILQGILPICAVCKKIRDGEGRWVPMERYISGHSDTKFSHGYCPECAKAFMEEADLMDTDKK